MQVLMNEDKIKDHTSESNGLCIECGEISYGGIEPDAISYPCEMCGEQRVVGMETALMYGWVIASVEKYPMLKGVANGKSNTSP